MRRTENQWEHGTYILGLAFKAMVGLAQLLGGLGLWLVPGAEIRTYVMQLARLKLVADPGDRLALWVKATVSALPVADVDFYTVYLCIHGLLNLTMVAALIASLNWAYPATIIALAAFVTYQTYDFFMGKGIVMLLFSAIDIVVIWLVWREWQIRRTTGHWPPKGMFFR